MEYKGCRPGLLRESGCVRFPLDGLALPSRGSHSDEEMRPRGYAIRREGHKEERG